MLQTAELTPLKWLNESIDNKDASVLSERKYVKYDLKKRDYVEVEGDDVINGYPYIDKPVACNGNYINLNLFFFSRPLYTFLLITTFHQIILQLY